MKLLIVLPAYNEEAILQQSVDRLVDFCQKNLGLIDWQIVIADNNSNDQTAQIGQALENNYRSVNYLFVPKQGKGTAIRAAWEKYQADAYCFMDADLATDLSALPKLILGIKAEFDLVIGSRFHRQSKVQRSWFRNFVSLAYWLVLKIFLATKINDAPCGFKIINRQVKTEILPQVKNDQWFFDSELLILAERAGYKIKEIPVSWTDPRKGADKSRVKVVSLGWAYFKKVIELRTRFKKK